MTRISHEKLASTYAMNNQDVKLVVNIPPTPPWNTFHDTAYLKLENSA